MPGAIHLDFLSMGRSVSATLVAVLTTGGVLLFVATWFFTGFTLQALALFFLALFLFALLGVAFVVPIGVVEDAEGCSQPRNS